MNVAQGKQNNMIMSLQCFMSEHELGHVPRDLQRLPIYRDFASRVCEDWSWLEGSEIYGGFKLGFDDFSRCK